MALPPEPHFLAIYARIPLHLPTVQRLCKTLLAQFVAYCVFTMTSRDIIAT